MRSIPSSIGRLEASYRLLRSGVGIADTLLGYLCLLLILLVSITLLQERKKLESTPLVMCI